MERALVDQMSVTTIRGGVSTAFFIFEGEAVSVQVSVPSRPMTQRGELPDETSKLAAAHALIRAAAELLREI